MSEAILTQDSANAHPLSHAPLPASHIRSQSQAFEAVKDVAFGSTAGILAKFVEYPFDTVKVRLQSRSSSSPTSGRLQGPFDAFAAAWRSPEGPLKNLYRGISAPLFGAAVETSSLFFSYRIAQDILVATFPSLRAQRFKDDKGTYKLPLSALLFAGAASGAFTSLLLTPIELVKCKMQVPLQRPGVSSNAGHMNSKLPGPVQILKSIFKSQGLLGFWHGQLGTLIRETGGSAAWFGSYEGVKMLFERYNHTVSDSQVKHGNTSAAAPSTLLISQQLLAGAIAGVSYNFCFYPADTIKSRMQTEQTAVLAEGSSRPTTFLRTGTDLWREQGLKGFYRGCGITVFRAARARR